MDCIVGISYYLKKMLDAVSAPLMTIILSFSKKVHWCILCSSKSNYSSAKLNFLSAKLWPHNSPELRESYSSISMI